MSDRQVRPAGVSAIASLFLCAAGASAIIAACTLNGWWSLASGRFIVGDLVVLGPAVFVLAAVGYTMIGFGLLAVKNWARRAAIVVAAVGCYFLVAPMSSAVVDLRLGAMALDGAQIILRVIVIGNLMREDAGKAFVSIREVE